MILIGPGTGDSLVLYDHNLNYDAVLVAPSSADLYWSYVDEPADASRFIATVPLDTEVVVPLSTEVDRDITIRAITRSAYSPATSGQPDFNQSEQVTAESDRLAKAVLGLAVKAGRRFARISVDNWNRFSRVRKVDVTTDATFTAYTTFYFDLDRRKAAGGPADTEAEFNELPDYIDLERLPPNYPAGIAWSSDIYYVRVSHSVQSSGRAVGATYQAKVASLRYSEVSNVLVFTFEGVSAGSAAGGVVGLPDPFPYPAGGGSGIVDSIRVSGDEYHLATPYRHGLVSADLPYGQYLGGRKVWTGQQIFANGAIDDWTRDGGNLGPIKTSGLRTAPTLPADTSLTYHADVSGDHVQIAAHGVWRHDTTPDPARRHFYRSTHNAGVTDDPPFFDTALALGRIAPAVWTNAAWRYSGRIDFALEAAIGAASNVVPVSVDIYGGSASSNTTDATGTRGLRIDSRGNAVLGVGALAVDSVGGYAYLPQFVGTPTTSAPAATHTGYVPVAMVGTDLKVWNGSAWVGLAGAGSAKWNAITAPDGNQSLTMAGHTSEWTWGTTIAADGLLMQNTATGGSGAVLYVRTTHASSSKIPFRVDAQNVLSFYVDSTGRVGVKTIPNVSYEFTVGGKSYLGGDTDVAGRLTATYSTATLSNRTLFVSSTLTGSNTQSSLYYANLLTLTDESTAGTNVPYRTPMLFRYSRATAGSDFTVYGLVSDVGYSAASGTLAGPLWAFKAQGNTGSGTATLTTYGGFYAEYPSGFGFLTNTYGFVAEGGLFNGFGTTLPTATLHVLGTSKLANSTGVTTGIQTLATFEHLSTGAPADGYGVASLYNLSTTVQARLAAQMDVRWQESTDADRSAVMSLRTIHKGQTVARERLLVGGYKALVDNTRTDIFSVVFDVADQKAVCGTVHLTVVAKQVTGSNQIQVYRKSIAFLALHNAATNTGTGRWGAETSGDAVTTMGGITFTFECNTVAYPSYAGTTNTLTYQLTANTDLTTVSEFYVQFNVEMNGETDITLL